MKTIYITALIFLSAFLSIPAQDSNTNTSHFGLKGGYSLAAVSFNGDGETGQRHGFHLGFYGESFLSNHFSMQVELLYAQQGYKIEDNGGTFTQKIDYINVPLMLKPYLSNALYLEVGPQVGLAISHKETFDDNFGVFDTSQEFDPQNFDWGINFGGGIKTDSGVSLGVRYHLGLGNIYDDGSPKNRVWQFSIGFDF